MLKMGKVILLLWSTLFIMGGCRSAAPGVKIMLTPKGVNYAGGQALKIIAQQMKKVVFPARSGQYSMRLTGTRVNYQFNPMKVLKFEMPTMELGLGPGAQVSAKFNGAGVALGGDWLFRFRFIKLFGRPVGMGENGALNLGVKDVKFSTVVKLGIKNGLPKIDASNCFGEVGKFNLVATSNNKVSQFLYSIFTRFVSNAAKFVINSQICKEAVSSINKNGNSMLQTMTLKMPVVRNLADVDYKLSANPGGTNHGLEFPLKGDIKDPEELAENVTTPAPPHLPPIGGAPNVSASNGGPMVMIQFSDFMFNSLTNTLHKQKVFKMELTQNLIPPLLRPLLRMDCKILRGQLCIGLFLPQIRRKHRKGFLELHVSSTVAPSIHTQSNKISGKAGFNVGFVVRDGNTMIPVFNTKLGIDMGIKAMIKGRRLIWQITNLLPTIQFGQNNNVQKLLAQSMDSTVKTLAQDVMLPVVNQMFKQGFPLPTLDGIHFWKPMLAIQERNLLVGVDFSYEPNLKNQETEEELPLMVQRMLDTARANKKKK